METYTAEFFNALLSGATFNPLTPSEWVAFSGAEPDARIAYVSEFIIITGEGEGDFSFITGEGEEFYFNANSGEVY